MNYEKVVHSERTLKIYFLVDETFLVIFFKCEKSEVLFADKLILVFPVSLSPSICDVANYQDKTSA